MKLNAAMKGFLLATDQKSYESKSSELIKKGSITKESLKKAVIEEFIIGAQVNFNYFYSILDDELELMGTDTRRQTNLDGLIRLPADQQLEILNMLNQR